MDSLWHRLDHLPSRHLLPLKLPHKLLHLLRQHLLQLLRRDLLHVLLLRHLLACGQIEHAQRLGHGGGTIGAIVKFVDALVLEIGGVFDAGIGGEQPQFARIMVVDCALAQKLGPAPFVVQVAQYGRGPGLTKDVQLALVTLMEYVFTVPCPDILFVFQSQ